MFSGIIEEIGRVIDIRKELNGMRLFIESKKVINEIKEGDSVSVDGVCLTVEEVKKDFFTVYCGSETMKKTTLKDIKRDFKVNLESSLKVGKQLGGHFVQGHVEDVGTVKSLKRLSEENEMVVELNENLMKYVVPKGSIAISGVSLTVSKVEGNRVTINVIPYTIKKTNLGFLKVGDKVNVETDVINRIVVNYLERNRKIDIEKLIEEGF